MSYSFIVNKSPSGELEIVSNFSEPLSLVSMGSEAILTITNIDKLKSLDKIVINTSGVSDTRVLKSYFSIALSDVPDKYTDWIEITNEDTTNCLDISPFYSYNVRFKFERVGINELSTININSIKWTGTWDINITNNSAFIITPSNDPIIYQVPNTYKVFNLAGYELLANNMYLGLNIEYRYSQDNKRTWTTWKPLTNDNLVAEPITPIRFFNIEYKFEHTGDVGQIEIADLVLVGEMIDITTNYTKSEGFGIRQNCPLSLLDSGISDSISGGTGSGSEPLWTAKCDPTKLFKPYKLEEASSFYEKMNNDAAELFGWPVNYFKTSPDVNGIDYSFNEYSLYNVIDVKDVKVVAPKNNLPNGEARFNKYDLTLLDVFEVHITKKMFKDVFGEQYKPSKEDFLYFCEVNRMFQVEHAQELRGFNNARVYYKVILKKYNQKKSVKAESTTIQERMQDILKNSTYNDLFNTEITDDKENVANKKQQETLSNDVTRETPVLPDIIRELIMNSTLVVSKNHYHLNNVGIGEIAVKYLNPDVYLTTGNNRSITAWVKFDTIDENITYNIINNRKSGKGYRVDIVGNTIRTMLDDNIYETVFNFQPDIWYVVLSNIDQSRRFITHHIAKRNADREIDAKRIATPELLFLLNDIIDNIVPINMDYKANINDIELTLLGSPMKITNIRIFDDVIDETKFNLVLNQQIIRDSSHLIMADNANVRINTTKYPYN